MSKKVTKALILCALMSLLTGCYPTGELEQPDKPAANNSTTADGGEISEPAEFTMPNDLKNVKFNFELGDDYPSEVPVIKAKLRSFDVEKLKAMFIDGKTVTEETSHEFGGRFTTSDGASLSFGKGRFCYAVDHYYDDEEKHNIYDLQITHAGNLRVFYQYYQYLDSELEGFPRSEALKRAEELVKKTDLRFFCKPEIYAFTAEDVENVLPVIVDKEGHETEVHLPKEDEFYLVKYNIEYNGIPIASGHERIFEDATTASPTLEIIMTKDSLVDFSCYNVFDSIEVVDITQIKCGAESAMSNVYDHYKIKDSQITEYKLEYNSFDIEYATYESDYSSGEFVFKPMWHLSGTQILTPNGRHYNHVDKFADPVTGYVYEGGRRI